MDQKPVIDLDKALGLTRDGEGAVNTAPRFRFVKIRFPKQKVLLPKAGVTIEFRLLRQNDPSQGAPVGIFETDDVAVARELAEIMVAKSDLCIVRDNS